jgi:hypothetical protein
MLWLAAGAGPLFAAGQLSTILEAEGSVRNDGNYRQVSQVGQPSKNDTLARGGFHLRLSYVLPRLELALGYSPSYEWLLSDTQVSATNHRLDLGLIGRPSRRDELRIRERLLKSAALDLYEPFAEPEPLAVPRRGDLLSQSLDVAFQHELSRRSSLLVGATETLRTFAERDLADTRTLGGRVGFAFRLTPQRQIEANAEVGRYDFGSLRGSANVQRLGVAWSQSVYRDGRFRIEAGTFAADSDRRELVAPVPGSDGTPVLASVHESRNGWRGGVDLSLLRETFSWNVGARHDVSAGFGLGRATEVDNAFAGASTTTLGRRLTLGVDGNYARHSGLAQAGESRPRLTDFAAGTARLSWNFSQAARLTGGYSRIWQEAKVEPFTNLSFSRYFVGLAVRLYGTGETPKDPAHLGETPDEQSDPQ